MVAVFYKNIKLQWVISKRPLNMLFLRELISKIGEALYQYQPCNERVYPLFVCARQGRLIAEVERYTYFQLPVIYHTESDYPSYATR